MDVIPDQLWEAAKAAGWFGTVFTLFMWWLERGERRELKQENKDLEKENRELLKEQTERLITAMNNAVTGMQALRDLITAGGRREG